MRKILLAMIEPVINVLMWLGAVFWIFRLGKQKQQLENERERNEKNRDANTLRDRLRSDPSFAERVRERFTRR